MGCLAMSIEEIITHCPECGEENDDGKTGLCFTCQKEKERQEVEDQFYREFRPHSNQG